MFIAIYLTIMTPENAQFDSRWKHMGLAEEWVARGGIERFPEGLTGNPAALHKLLFAWGFMAPGTLLFDQVLLCAHIEFWVFLITTVFGIPALVRRLVPGASPRLLWVVRFLFPGHFSTIQASRLAPIISERPFYVPVFIMALETLRRCEPRRAILLGYVMAGAALVKYTIAMFFYPATLAIFFFGAIKGLKNAVTRKEALLGVLALVLAGLVSSSPHWLKNFIWYGNPVYPLLPQLFNNDPWTADATYAFKYAYQQFQFWRPERSMDGVLETLQTLFTFSFIPHDYPNYHGKTPVIGSLFTLALLTLPFLRIQRAGGKRRFPWKLLVLFLVTHSAVFIWYWIHHQDRYLQGLMPWMAACTAAVIVLIWRHGGLIAHPPSHSTGHPSDLGWRRLLPPRPCSHSKDAPGKGHSAIRRGHKKRVREAAGDGASLDQSRFHGARRRQTLASRQSHQFRQQEPSYPIGRLGNMDSTDFGISKRDLMKNSKNWA